MYNEEAMEDNKDNLAKWEKTKRNSLPSHQKPSY
jgi:hypothetical protein